jgi:hypothetical protein
MMREYELRVSGLRVRARFAPEATGHQDANPAPGAQKLTDAPKQMTRRGSGYSITSSARASSGGGTTSMRNRAD